MSPGSLYALIYELKSKTIDCHHEIQTENEKKREQKIS